jgi:hypothetical protein
MGLSPGLARLFVRPTGPAIRVMSFNISFGSPGVSGVVAQVREFDADLVLLQDARSGIEPVWARHSRAGTSVPMVSSSWRPAILFETSWSRPISRMLRALAERISCVIRWKPRSASWTSSTYNGRLRKPRTCEGPPHGGPLSSGKRRRDYPRRFRQARRPPTRPVPNRRREPGSGTGAVYASWS